MTTPLLDSKPAHTHTPEATPPPRDPRAILTEWYYNHFNCGQTHYVTRPPADLIPDTILAGLLNQECIWDNNPQKGIIYKPKDLSKFPCPSHTWTDDNERRSAIESFQNAYMALDSEKEDGTGWVGLQKVIEKAGLTYVKYNTLATESAITGQRSAIFSGSERMVNFHPIDNK
ncbi:hypothetical protein KBC75_01730 [Candidatus Shapirobacteria bacterium]|nr:hypothetical protein [Candidatus Shapirobacteria bacterium]